MSEAQRNQHKSESPASQKAGSTNLDALQPAALNVVADAMGDVLHEPRSPSPAELDAWARARHRRDRARGSRQSDGRTGAETRLVKSWSRVGPFGARTAPLEPVKWRNRRAGCPTGGRGGLRDSLTRTIEERRQALSAPVSTPYNEILCGQPAPPPGETADGHHHPQARMTADALSRRRSRLELPALPAGVDAAHAAGLMTRAARGDDAALAALERTAAWSRNTLRTYLRAWTAWTRWAAAAGVPAMPASAADVRAFVLTASGTPAGRSPPRAPMSRASRPSTRPPGSPRRCGPAAR